MKKYLLLMLTALLLIVPYYGSIEHVSASNEIKVYIDGELQRYDQPPIIVDGRTLVPMRGIFERLGASVDYREQTRTIHSQFDGRTLEMKVGETKANLDGRNVSLDVASQINNSRTLVPLRFISETIGANVAWDGNMRVVTIDTKSSQSQPNVQQSGGLLKGKITWKSDDATINLPDTQSKVYLIPTSFNYQEVTQQQAELIAMGVWQEGISVHTATIDEKGEYVVNRISPGEYYVVISSYHVEKGENDTTSSSVRNTFEPLFGPIAYDLFAAVYLENEHIMEKIVVNDKQLVIIDHEFSTN
ncbi:copper amine oxidase N-terminal domain-containing protein [Bacillus sp. FJAT-45350]|uniref:copper amine oxidase N-terminal domain-containing protein n=1 Tax=Bacillus sp. FJAT-45350 TaxID=2011014 RepID=UPI000BB72856|nr:copper amine oxidase N-terminal domain-containing protein [Bacillus sp. FJAT-45350]